MHIHNHNDHSHSHSHDEPTHHHHVHTHGHSHFVKSSNKIFFFSILFNVLFIVAEFYYGFISKSLALVSDASHNLGDVAGLLLSWVGIALGSRLPKGRFTYGLQSASILTAIINSVILLVAVGAILVEAFNRLMQPQAINADMVIVIALIGIAINGGTALMFMFSGSKELNMKAAFWHMAGDTLVSVGVVISAVVIKYTGFIYMDGITSILIAVVILFASWGLLKDSIVLSLQAAPNGVDIEKVKAFLLGQKNVKQVLDLHVWAISTTETALSTHLNIPEGVNDEFLIYLEKELEEHFHIGHATIQVMRKDFIPKSI